MSERRIARRGPATTLRVAGGVIAVLAPLALGALGHSPWKALLLVPAFAASYALGRLSRGEPSPTERSTVTVIGAALSILIVQLVLVGVLYLLGLGIGALVSDVLPLEPLVSGDLLFVGLVWVVTLGCAAASLLIERGRTPPTAAR